MDIRIYEEIIDLLLKISQKPMTTKTDTVQDARQVINMLSKIQEEEEEENSTLQNEILEASIRLDKQPELVRSPHFINSLLTLSSKKTDIDFNSLENTSASASALESLKFAESDQYSNTSEKDLDRIINDYELIIQTLKKRKQTGEKVGQQVGGEQLNYDNYKNKAHIEVSDYLNNDISKYDCL
jgi:hypothetical protein